MRSDAHVVELKRESAMNIPYSGIYRTSIVHSLEYKEYKTGSNLDHQANVLSGISCFVWRPYKYKVYDRGTTASQGLSAW